MQQSEDRPKITTNTTLVLPVFIVDEALVVCASVGEGRWSLPIVPVLPKWGIDVALKKYFKDTLNLDFASMLDCLDTSLPVYFHMDNAANSRVFQNAFVFRVSKEVLNQMTPPAEFGLLPLDGIADAPDGLIVMNHKCIILDASEVGK